MDETKVKQLISELQTGDSGSASCALGAMGSGVIPALRAEYACSQSPAVRLSIVEVLGEFRRPEDVPFFGEALMDPNEAVWQAAIDALASVPGPASLQAVRTTLTRLSAVSGAESKKWSYLQEAVSELQKAKPFSVGGPDDGAV